MKMKGMIITTLMLLLSATLSAQSHQPSDIRPQPSDRMAAYREAIGLDMTVPDFSTKKIDAKMGTRLANILRYFEENYSQGFYSRWITSVLREQNEEFEHVYPEVTKIKMESASKLGNEITVKYKIWLGDNPRKIKQTLIAFHFIDGVSESKTVNEMFSYMSRYVQAREQLNK